MRKIKELIMRYWILIVPVVVFAIILVFLTVNIKRKEKPVTQSPEIVLETVSEEIYKTPDDSKEASAKEAESDYEEDDYSWMLPKADHENFTEEEKKQMEADTLEKFGVLAVTDDAGIYNGESLRQFYDDYLAGKPGAATVYQVYEDGKTASYTFLYRDEEIQCYYVGVCPDADGQPHISEKTVKEIETVNLTEKGYFIYKDKNPMLHASAYGYFRISPMPEECRKLTDRFLKDLELQKYDLMLCDWNGETVREHLKPGMFEDFYYMKYKTAYRDSLDAIPGGLFEEIMTTYLPVTVADLKDAYEYDETAQTYREEAAYNSPYPPFLEATDYKYNSDGTITIYADGVWPDHNTDCAFTNVISVKPFEDGTFRILSNDVTLREQY